MRLIENLLRRVRGKGEGEVALKDELPWFDRKDALRRVDLEVTDPLRRHKIYELLEQGFVVIEHAVDTELCEKASAVFLEWRNRNKDARLKFQESDGRLNAYY